MRSPGLADSPRPARKRPECRVPLDDRAVVHVIEDLAVKLHRLFERAYDGRSPKVHAGVFGDPDGSAKGRVKVLLCRINEDVSMGLVKRGTGTGWGGERETCDVGDHVVRFEAVKVQRHEIEHAFALASPNPLL
jgi:hypothetical protein